MNSRFKFRAWDKQSRKMIYFDFADIYGYGGCGPLESSGVVLPDKQTFLNYNSGYGNQGFNDNLILMLSIGFYDKNEKLIFEKDIARQPRCGCEHCSSHGKYRIFEICKMDYFGHTNLARSSWIEIIGNKFDNPDLIQKEEQG